MISLPIISIICCFAYVFYIIFRYGVPVSISETYYLLPSKLDWLFAAWTVMTAVPFGIYWFTIAVPSLKWIPIVVAIALLMIGVADCYKSGPKKEIQNYVPNIVSGNINCEPTIKKGWKEFLKELLKKFNPKEFFKYGLARLIHYVNSLIAIILSTVYICMIGGPAAITCAILSYIAFIVIGLKVDGVYNADYSADVDNKAWIFFMEIVCLINLFVFIFI